MSNENKPIVGWQLKIGSSPLGETGDYQPYAYITNGKIVLYVDKEDYMDEELLQPIVDKLNTSIEPAAEMSEEELEKIVNEFYPFDDPRKNMHHNNGGQLAKQLAFKDGYRLRQSHHAEMQKEIERLRESLNMILMLCEENGKPVDGFRFRENIIEARQLLAK